MTTQIDKALGIYPLAASVQARRMELVAGNLANASTPNYRATDIDFRELMAAAGDSGELVATHPEHRRRIDALTADALKYRIPLSPSRDGNTVESHVEEAAYGDASTRYLSTLRFIENSLSGVRKAFRGD